MSTKSNIRMPHRVDILTKSTTTNDMGQHKASWTTVTSGVHCFVTPSGASTSIRVLPTIEQADYLTVYLPHDTQINYGSRLQNFVLGVGGGDVYPGIYQVTEIDRHVSFSGRPQYLQVTVKSVIE